MAISRRSFLLHGTALATTVSSANTLASEIFLNDSLETIVGYIGENVVQLTIIDTVFNVPEAITVSSKDHLAWSPDPTDTFGSVGTLNGIAGNFSGDQNVSQPQMFASWPRVAKGSLKKGFRKSNELLAPADQLEYWDFSINGQPAKILSLFRKTVPICTLAIDVRKWESTKRHLLTFELDRNIPEGATVRIKGPSVIEIENRKSENAFSESIHVCQAGYPSTGPKKVYVGAWWGHDKNGISGNTDAFLSEKTKWSLISERNGEKVLSGNLSLVKPADEPHWKEKNFNGCDIYEANFSYLDAVGDFRIMVEGFGVSFPFGVSQSPYNRAFRLAARWYFHQRSGCSISKDFGEGRTRPRNGHPDDGLIVLQTSLKLGDTSEGFGKLFAGKHLSDYVAASEGNSTSQEYSVPIVNSNAWGGWHDAGDWDRRIQHMEVVYQMAEIVETYQHSRTLDLNLPESGKPFSHPDVKARKNDLDLGDKQTVLPDLIHEALWGISLWRRTQLDDGAIIGGVEYSRSGIIGSVSWNPVQTAFAYGPEDWAAYRFAVGAAKLGHVIKTVCGDEILGDAIVNEALKAWHWAEQEFSSSILHLADVNPNRNETKNNIYRARVAAAAVIYRASGDNKARNVFEDHNPFVPLSPKPAEGIKKGVFPYCYLDYVRASREGKPTNPDIVSAIEGWIKYRAKKGKRMGRDYGLHSTGAYPWGRGWLRFGPGSNWRASHFSLYFASEGNIPKTMREAAVEGMWFGMGCNPSNVSFIQGLGNRDFSDPLLTDKTEKSGIPGQISFGVSGGNMHSWEKRKTSGAIFPETQDNWPIYTQIFESRSVGISSEHGIKSNALQWLIACAITTSF